MILNVSYETFKIMDRNNQNTAAILAENPIF